MPAKKKSRTAKVTGRIGYGKKSTRISDLRFSDTGALTLSGSTGRVMDLGAVGSGKAAHAPTKRKRKSSKP
jgi:hypothetical protein